MQRRKDLIPWWHWLPIGLLLLVLGGCVAPDGSHIHFQQAQDGAIVGWQVDRPAPVRPILYTSVTDDEPSVHAVDQDGTVLGTWENARLLGWSPHGDRFAYLTEDMTTHSTQLVVATIGEAGDAIFDFTPDEQVYAGHPSIWSPDGTQIALVVWGTGADFPSFRVVLIDAISGELIQELNWLALCSDACMTTPTFAKWSPDGQKLLIGGIGGAVSFDIAHEKIEPVLDIPDWLSVGDGYFYHSEVFWLPNSDGVLYFHYDYRGMNQPGREEIKIKYLDQPPAQLLTQEQLIALGIDVQAMLLIRISPSGSYLALADSNYDGGWSTLLIFDLAELQSTLRSNVPEVNPIAEWKLPGSIDAIEWSPDGSAIAFMLMSDERSTVEVLQLTSDSSKSVADVSLNEDISYFYGTSAVAIGNLLSWTP